MAETRSTEMNSFVSSNRKTPHASLFRRLAARNQQVRHMLAAMAPTSSVLFENIATRQSTVPRRLGSCGVEVE